jgi:hypothetical protein
MRGTAGGSQPRAQPKARAFSSGFSIWRAGSGSRCGACLGLLGFFFSATGCGRFKCCHLGFLAGSRSVRNSRRSGCLLSTGGRSAYSKFRFPFPLDSFFPESRIRRERQPRRTSGCEIPSALSPEERRGVGAYVVLCCRGTGSGGDEGLVTNRPSRLSTATCTSRLSSG